MDILTRLIKPVVRRVVREELAELLEEEPLSDEVRASLKESLEDVRQGRTYGPFDSAQELIAHLNTPKK